MMDETRFRCMNCGKSTCERERASMPLPAKVGFFLIFLMLTRAFTSPWDVCRSCSWQFYLLVSILLVVVAAFALLSAF